MLPRRGKCHFATELPCQTQRRLCAWSSPSRAIELPSLGRPPFIPARHSAGNARVWKRPTDPHEVPLGKVPSYSVRMAVIHFDVWSPFRQRPLRSEHLQIGSSPAGSMGDWWCEGDLSTRIANRAGQAAGSTILRVAGRSDRKATIFEIGIYGCGLPPRRCSRSYWLAVVAGSGRDPAILKVGDLVLIS
jgi:hypothetical protein